MIERLTKKVNPTKFQGENYYTELKARFLVGSMGTGIRWGGGEKRDFEEGEKRESSGGRGKGKRGTQIYLPKPSPGIFGEKGG